MSLVDPNLSEEEINDSELIQEYQYPKKYKPILLYAIMSKRANNNEEIKKILFEVISNESYRKVKIFGIIMQSWLPAIHMLEYGTNELKSELKELLRTEWTFEEKDFFLIYIKQNEDYYNFLKSIIDKK